MIDRVFVYGTLKRGQCRAPLWPQRPRSIVAGWTEGRLYGRHDYPAMTSGADRVLGECWRFEPSQVEAVLDVLDRIEGTNQPGQDDLYVRVIVDVYGPDGAAVGPAWTYHYASDPVSDGFEPIGADRRGCVSWVAP